MKHLRLPIMAILLFCVLACGQSIKKNSPADIQNNWNVLDDSLYSIRYPDSWGLNASGYEGTSFILYTEQSSLQDRYNENISLVIQELADSDNKLDQFIEVTEDIIRTKLNNGKLIESTRHNADGREYQKIIYLGRQRIYNLKFEQYFWVEDGKSYVLTLSCKVNEFDRYKETGEAILNSFRIKQASIDQP